ncbi:hypothetical protein L9G74_11310 [Shewanella sp. C32]|uniref:Uncharacterized protein n=1 Tax=Shewanella electrica TaxID=515560 RepID=A0ABT2FL30_9GAMM|nr:hypothetical protein [Shewanella electrica]MCH1923814.1 hypothetical protein [Shewanella electrica]MCS4557032.1 hypothetical protein [Shewanella electrica]
MLLVAVVHLILLSWFSLRPVLPVLAEVKPPPLVIHSFLYRAPTKVNVLPPSDIAPDEDITTEVTVASAAVTPNHSSEATIATSAGSASDSVIDAAPATTPVNEIKPVAKVNIRDLTANYLQQQQSQAIGKLPADYATSVSKQGFSDMTAKPKSLQLPQQTLSERDGSLDAALDPNRIVKVGSTCYRVVKTPTQLNPYAENLGFPFKCGQTDDEKLLEASLKARIQQHRQKPY